MKLLLFTGFLGSGKSTLILALARRAAACGARLAIVVNEVGEVGIDGQVFRLGELEVVEITAGCICCQIGADLVRALRELAETFGPELVIVEASGIATPGGVLDAVRRYPPPGLYGIETVTVVDPTRFEALHEVLTPLIEAQLSEADRVVITRLDEATAAEVEATRAAVARLAPAARLHLVEASREETLEGMAAELLAALPGDRPAPDAPEGQRS